MSPATLSDGGLASVIDPSGPLRCRPYLCRDRAVFRSRVRSVALSPALVPGALAGASLSGCAGMRLGDASKPQKCHRRAARRVGGRAGAVLPRTDTGDGTFCRGSLLNGTGGDRVRPSPRATDEQAQAVKLRGFRQLGIHLCCRAVDHQKAGSPGFTEGGQDEKRRGKGRSDGAT